MSGNIYFIRRWLKVDIALRIGWIAKKDAGFSVRLQLMSIVRPNQRKASTTKDSKICKILNKLKKKFPR